MNILLISTYELGRQPFGLASPAAWLGAAGHQVISVDLSRQRLSDDVICSAGLVAFHLPMHTATRLALPVLERVIQQHADVHLCCYGLYASLNRSLLESLGVGSIFGGEFEQDLVDLAAHLDQQGSLNRPPPIARRDQPLPRLQFIVPSRAGLPALARYAALEVGEGERRTVGYTEASRGCKHLCRHCPIVPVYEGQFRVVQREVVLEDIRQQVAQGAQHITFGDPDFFNGVGHAIKIVEELARSCPGVTYDVTIKVEHLLQYVDRLPRLVETGCLFVTSAVESVDDRVLTILRKGHTRADVVRVVEQCRAVGLTLTPTFVPFTPWTTLESYCDLLATVDDLGLVASVAPIQFAIRLLLPPGSCLLERPDVQSVIRTFQPSSLMFPWRHPDPRVDLLQREVAALVAAQVGSRRQEVFHSISALAHDYAGLTLRPAPDEAPNRATVPYLNEPWYC